MDIILAFLLLGAVAVALLFVFMLFRALRPDDRVYQCAVGIALVTALLLFWLNGAVGIIGAADNDANLMYAGVLAVGMIGAIIARFEPRGMAIALLTTAVAQGVVTGVALIAGLGYPASPPLELLGVNGFFAALWVASALLFRNAAAQKDSSDCRAPACRPAEE